MHSVEDRQSVRQAWALDASPASTCSAFSHARLPLGLTHTASVGQLQLSLGTTCGSERHAAMPSERSSGPIQHTQANHRSKEMLVQR